jgi:hypothetical protein
MTELCGRMIGVVSKTFGITDKIYFARNLESFQTAGKMSVDKDRLNRSISGTLTTEANFLSMDGEMPSRLGSFCLSSLKTALSTTVCVSLIKNTLCDSSSGKVSSLSNETGLF